MHSATCWCEPRNRPPEQRPFRAGGSFSVRDCVSMEVAGDGMIAGSSVRRRCSVRWRRGPGFRSPACSTRAWTAPYRRGDALGRSLPRAVGPFAGFQVAEGLVRGAEAAPQRLLQPVGVLREPGDLRHREPVGPGLGDQFLVLREPAAQLLDLLVGAE